MNDTTSTTPSDQQTQTTPNETSSENQNSPQGTPTPSSSVSATPQDQQNQQTEEFTPLANADITLPEGFEFADDRMTAALEIVNEYKIPKEAVDKLFALNAEWAGADATAAAEAAGPSFEDTVNTWQDEVRKLPEIGGQNLERTTATINRLLQENTEGFGADFDKMLDMTGAGSHPLMIRFLHGVAEKLGVNEGTPAPSGAPADAPKTLAQRMYPNHS